MAEHSLRSKPEVSKSDRDPTLNRSSVEYLAGRLSEPEFIQRGSELGPAWLAIAHYTIGMQRLSARDRTGAQLNFQQAVDLLSFAGYDGEWAQAYLERMVADPAWPPWLNAQNSK